jgi:hypothetical protein
MKQLRNCGRAWSDQNLLRLFMLITDTARAEIKALLLPVNKNDSRMDIRFPASICMTLRVADSITELRGFPTNIALQNRYSLTSTKIYSILY